MSEETAYGWRSIDTGDSSGLDFLGLAVPIEKNLDAETSGITNATERARYFTIVPWYYWRYAEQGGTGSAKDQRRFAIGFETFIAYANIAWLEKSDSRMTGIIRREFCEKEWKKRNPTLPLRDGEVPSTPSPLDAALYGPSLRRLDLLGRLDQLHSFRRAGQIMARELETTLGNIDGCDSLISAVTIERTVVENWADHLSLAKPSAREINLLRQLFFAYGEFATEATPPRVYTMLLLVKMSLTTSHEFAADDIEVALATGVDLSGVSLKVEPLLQSTYTHWRILALLKFLRHASELAFAAIHSHVRTSGIRFASAELAADDLIKQTTADETSTTRLPSQFQALVEHFESGVQPPGWKPPSEFPTDVLKHAVKLCAWCYALLSTQSARVLLNDEMSLVGRNLDADLAGYFEQLESFHDSNPAFPI